MKPARTLLIVSLLVLVIATILYLVSAKVVTLLNAEARQILLWYGITIPAALLLLAGLDQAFNLVERFRRSGESDGTPRPSERPAAGNPDISSGLLGPRATNHDPAEQASRQPSKTPQSHDIVTGTGWLRRGAVKIPDIAWGEIVRAGDYSVGGDSAATSSFKEQIVRISQPYQLARFPVTNAQFRCFATAPDFTGWRWWAGMPSYSYGGGVQTRKLLWKNSANNHPCTRVSWYQAVAFCRWLSDKLGYDVDLPTEYEWEVAARYPDGRYYPWGNEFDATKANTKESGIGATSAVGDIPDGKNPALGLYDLSGNVWEWCRNKYDTPADIQVDGSNAIRALRGGSWGSGHGVARAAYRNGDNPLNRSTDDGFRLVRRPVRR